MAEQADAYVLETYANSVRVQVSLPAPFMSRVAVGGRNARVHTIVGSWRLCISRTLYGLLAQLGERLPCKQEVVGSIPTGSTIKCLLILSAKHWAPKEVRDVG